MNAARAYARTQQETASKERLMVMLFEAALKHIRLGATALEAKKPAEAVPSLTKASDIVVELMGTLDRAQAPELCETLAAVYQFVALKLTRASLAQDAASAREAERAFAPIVEAFQVAVAQQTGAAGSAP